MKEDIIGLFQETVEDTSSEIPSIVALLRINKHDLDQTVTNELDFILGAVFSQIINRFKIYSTNRSMKISESDLDVVLSSSFFKSRRIQTSYPKVIKFFLVLIDSLQNYSIFNNSIGRPRLMIISPIVKKPQMHSSSPRTITYYH